MLKRRARAEVRNFMIACVWQVLKEKTEKFRKTKEDQISI